MIGTVCYFVSQAAVNFEENESASRTTDQDMKLFHKTCDTIRQIMKEIEDLKKVPDKVRPWSLTQD